jgi:hypothetical protein
MIVTQMFQSGELETLLEEKGVAHTAQAKGGSRFPRHGRPPSHHPVPAARLTFRMRHRNPASLTDFWAPGCLCATVIARAILLRKAPCQPIRL